MKKTGFIKFIGCLCILWFSILMNLGNAKPLGDPSETNDKPNFLFILVDDLGWADTGAYGNTYHDTPHIDRLASEGMRFTDAYAASTVCTPTRASLQTGLYPARIDINQIINPHRRPWAMLKPPPNNWHLPRKDHPTLAEALNKEGYTSTLIGKWNLGYDSPDMPQDRGYVKPPSADPSSLYQAYKDEIASYAAENPFKGIGPQTLQAVKFIQENKDRPFLCFLSYNAVHIKMEARQELIRKYRAKSERTDTDYHPKYSAMVETVDESVGYLMKVLDELHLTENTVVIFFSDNGGLIQVYHQTGPIVGTNAPLRGEKGNLYEGGIRVPLIVRWPGKIKTGLTSKVPVISNDFFPTFMELAGAEIPEAVGEDATSLLPILRESGTPDRDALYWHYPSYHHSTPAAAIRNGYYKLIEYYETGDIELYNLKEDIGERNNLADEMPAKARQLQVMLHSWQHSLQAGMPTSNPEFDPSKAYIWGVRPEFPWQKAPNEALPIEEKCKLLE